MKRIRLITVDADAQGTISRLEFGGYQRVALERPWIPTAPGGKPSASCVPAGIYNLRKHVRPSGAEVLALENRGLGVFYQAADRLNGVGRFLILIHVANFVTDIEGCIAPGREYVLSQGRHMVRDSADTMEEVMRYVRDDSAEIQIIRDNSFRWGDAE